MQLFSISLDLFTNCARLSCRPGGFTRVHKEGPSLSTCNYFYHNVNSCMDLAMVLFLYLQSSANHIDQLPAAASHFHVMANPLCFCVSMRINLYVHVFQRVNCICANVLLLNGVGVVTLPT